MQLEQGDISNHTLKSGEAIQIATGAQMPSGAMLLSYEENIGCVKERNKVTLSARYNNDVALLGEYLKKGEIIFIKGQISELITYLLLHLQDIKNRSL